MIDHLAQILSVLGIGGIGVAVVTALATRKRVGAETNEKIVATSGELIDDVRADKEAARLERNDERRGRILAEKRLRDWWERADAYAPWVRLVRGLLDDAGITYPPPPPLYPPDNE